MNMDRHEWGESYSFPNPSGQKLFVPPPIFMVKFGSMRPNRNLGEHGIWFDMSYFHLYGYNFKIVKKRKRLLCILMSNTFEVAINMICGCNKRGLAIHSPYGQNTT